MLLNNLPKEILEEIVCHLDRDYASDTFKHTRAKPALHALCLTSRNLSLVATKLLFEEVQLPTVLYSDEDAARESRSVHAFLTSCEANPSVILPRIKKVSYRWRTLGHRKETRIILIKILAQSPSLRYLDLDLGDVDYDDEASWYWDDVPRQSFANLEMLRLGMYNSERPGAEFLLQLCRIGRLRHLCLQCKLAECEDKIWSKRLRETPIHQYDQLRDETSIQLETVELSPYKWGPDLSVDALRMLLPNTPQLKSLNISLPTPGVLGSWMEDPVEGRDVLSPCTIRTLLLPIRTTIQSLSLFGTQDLVWFHDGSLIDLSDFLNLEHLTISVHLLCVSSRGDNARNPSVDFWKLLPRHLKTLTIGFESEKGIFWGAEELENLDGPGRKFDDGMPPFWGRHVGYEFDCMWREHLGNLNEAKETVAWVKEVVENRDGTLPDLRELTVRQTARWGVNETWGEVDVLPYIPDLFDVSEGLSVKVLVVVPSCWEGPGVEYPQFGQP